MRGNKLSVNKSKKESQRDVRMAKGGKTPMFRRQAAGTDRAGNTGKDQTTAPGASHAEWAEEVQLFFVGAGDAWYYGVSLTTGNFDLIRAE